MTLTKKRVYKFLFRFILGDGDKEDIAVTGILTKVGRAYITRENFSGIVYIT